MFSVCAWMTFLPAFDRDTSDNGANAADVFEQHTDLGQQEWLRFSQSKAVCGTRFCKLT
jgi:hypothetical protein